MLMADLYVRMGVMLRKEGSSTRPLIVGRITACLRRGLTISVGAVSIPATPRCQSRSLATQSLCAARGSAYFCRASPIYHAILVYEMFFNPNFTSLTNGDYPPTNPLTACVSPTAPDLATRHLSSSTQGRSPRIQYHTRLHCSGTGIGQLKLKHQLNHLLRC